MSDSLTFSSDFSALRADFPILQREVYDRPLVYLDNAATTQKPLCVLDAMREEYLNVNANVHRGIHYLSVQATELHEAARERVRQFVNARSTAEIVFTRGTTEALNLVAATFSESRMQEGDEVIVSVMEHHSNIVPWQLAAARHGIAVRVVPMHDDGTLDLEAYRRLFTDRTRMVSLCHVSNVLGTVNPIAECIAIAHEHGVPVMVDGAQSAPHFPVDVQQLDCDFFAFSGHKMYGPTGIGVLYGKEEWLDRLPPYQGGGEMIETVSFEKTTFQQLPYKFEAGTPDYVATHGLATAIDYIENIGFDRITAHEQHLTHYCIQHLREMEGITVYGRLGDQSFSRLGNVGAGSVPAHAGVLGNSEADNAWGDTVGADASKRWNTHDAVVSFNVDGVHPSDIGTLLDRLGVAVRTGHHCAQPLMQRLGIPGTVRASFALYNNTDDVDALIAALRRVVPMVR